MSANTNAAVPDMLVEPDLTDEQAEMLIQIEYLKNVRPQVLHRPILLKALQTLELQILSEDLFKMASYRTKIDIDWHSELAYCPRCIETYKEGDTVIVSPCGHYGHASCMFKLIVDGFRGCIECNGTFMHVNWIHAVANEDVEVKLDDESRVRDLRVDYVPAFMCITFFRHGEVVPKLALYRAQTDGQERLFAMRLFMEIRRYNAAYCCKRRAEPDSLGDQREEMLVTVESMDDVEVMWRVARYKHGKHYRPGWFTDLARDIRHDAIKGLHGREGLAEFLHKQDVEDGEIAGEDEIVKEDD